MKSFKDFVNESEQGVWMDTLPSGCYRAICGGNQSRFQIDGLEFKAHFPTGVRGLNIQDTITITGGLVRSTVLGEATKVTRT